MTLRPERVASTESLLHLGQCEQLAGSEADEILDRLKAAPPVLLAPHADSNIAMESARKALQRAGYDLEI